MVTPDGQWQVEQITVLGGGRTQTRLRVTPDGGVFVGEVADVEQPTALGVPVAELVDDREAGHPG